MRIGIDYTAAARQGAGIGRYTRHLVRAVSELDRENDYVLFVAAGGLDREGFGSWPGNVRLRTVPLSDRWTTILWQRLRLPVPIQTVTGPLDLFHSPDFVLPPTGRTPALVTVHDLSFVTVPQFFVPGFCRYLNRSVRRAVRRADHILADSKCTRRDLVALMGVEARQVTVLYPGVEDRFCPVRDAETLDRVRNAYELPIRFVLGLGTLQPRKNFEGLIRGFARLMRAGRGEVAGDLHLVIAGGKGWMYDQCLAQAQREGIEQLVRFPGFVEDEDLPALYSLATLFAFPSWYEGFGLPILEAMACGTPVVAADNSSLPEVVGDAGQLVDAADVDALAAAMSRLLTNPSLREAMVEAGRARARMFTWGESARQLLEIYGALGRGRPREGCTA